MVLKTRRKLRSKTARAMLTWSHFAFRQKLKTTAEKFSAQVVEVTEEYTSKTCSFCGWIDEGLAGREKFQCKWCGSKVNRDINGSRGIFLKTMPATAFEFALPNKFNEIPIL
jgi:putative transposase